MNNHSYKVPSSSSYALRDQDLVELFSQSLTLSPQHQKKFVKILNTCGGHSDNSSVRKYMQIMIARMIEQCALQGLKDSNNNEVTKYHVMLALLKKKSVHLSKCIEAKLYEEAESFEYYKDVSTLACRIKNQITSAQMLKSGEPSIQQRRMRMCGALKRKRHEMLKTVVGNELYNKLVHTLSEIKNTRKQGMALGCSLQDPVLSHGESTRLHVRSSIGRLYFGTKLEYAVRNVECCTADCVRKALLNPQWAGLLAEANDDLSYHQELEKEGLCVMRGSCARSCNMSSVVV